MSKSKMDPAVDQFLLRAKQWPAELELLRTILLTEPLTETIKWRQPCYLWKDHNVAILGELKAGCTLSFFKGALLSDPTKQLVQPGQNTRAARYLVFTSVAEIRKRKPDIKKFIQEAIQLERSGAKIDFSENCSLEYPAELKSLWNEDPTLKKAFLSLSPGRQREYLLFFQAAKQSSTRTSRIQKFEDKIRSGKGMRDCTCGLSNRMPTCDGSHKQIS